MLREIIYGCDTSGVREEADISKTAGAYGKLRARTD